ncbi:MFS transporter [Lactobacillus iners]|nr:MFS transporter [Lactobacillus iners]EFO67705.1 transporter, major facilitator family protein [Lactobacillus iners LactinV 09V1-c]EFO71477.1 transporter, major facilitator family protein [Lactobacillus iners SPIN 2503V10-D]EFQ47304.1 transporter, major facilitator family protein [Lactobacillus iners LEAF 2053A-b]EFQ48704.1 transporter, major facilitator family protein [Lactobacillus iners LEAF 2052A-d]EFQ49933.1 transporter, major facilitator family protein [Lactobacillus iners LEAF 2062A-h
MKKTKSIYTMDVILVMAASFLFMFSVMFVTPLINGYALSLGADSILAGIITGSMSIVSIFLRPIAGNLVDLYSKYCLSLIGGILILIGVSGYWLVNTSGLLILFRLINGTGFVLATICMTTWLAFLVPRRFVGEAMGFYGLMNALAMAVAPLIAINSYKVIGYRYSMMIASLAAVIMLIMIKFVKNHAIPQNKLSLKNIKHIRIIQKDTIPVALLMLFFSIPYFATQADLVEYVAMRKLSVSVGYFFLIYALSLLIIRIWLKRFFDTIAFGFWFWLSLIAMIIFLISMAFMKNNFIMLIAAVALSIGYGVIYSINQTTALLLSPLDQQGLASSTVYLGLDLGMASAPILGGIIASTIPHFYFYPIMLIMVPFVLVIYFIYRKKLNGAIQNH